MDGDGYEYDQEDDEEDVAGILKGGSKYRSLILVSCRSSHQPIFLFLLIQRLLSSGVGHK
jgi:hypothetical protein